MLAAPSVPSATLTPASSSLRDGAKPARELQVRARAVHDVGAGASRAGRSPRPSAPSRARRSSSASRARAPRAARAAAGPSPRPPRRPRRPFRARACGSGRSSSSARRRTCVSVASPTAVRRVRRERRRDQRLGLEAIVDLEAFTQVLVGVLGPRRREVERDHAEHGAHAGFGRDGARDVGVEVHVGEARDAAGQHLGDREPRAVGHELGPDPAQLRPARSARATKSRTASRRRGRETAPSAACVCALTSPGISDVARALVAHARRVAAVGVANGQDVDDAPRIDREREAFLGDDLGLDAQGPSRTDQGVDRLHRQVSGARKKASKYSFPDVRPALRAQPVPVLDFRLVFWALGCVVGVMQEPLKRSSALPGKPYTSSTLWSPPRRRGRVEGGTVFY